MTIIPRLVGYPLQKQAIKMKLALFLTFLISLVFAAQTASISNQYEEINVIGNVQEGEKLTNGEATQPEGTLDETIQTEGNVQEGEQLTKDEATQTEDNDTTTECTHNFLPSVELSNNNLNIPDAIEDEIRHEFQLAQQVLEILRRPFNNPNDIENELEPLLETLETPQEEAEFAVYISDQNKPPLEPEQQYPIEIINHEIHSRKNPILEAPPDDLLAQNTIPVAELADEANENEIEPKTNPPLELPEIPSPIYNPYAIPGIDKRLIENFQGPVDQTWQGPDYQIRFKRDSPQGEVELWWKKGQDDIYLHSFPNGAADQNWGFGTVHIGLFRDEDGNETQLWNFGSTKLEYIVGQNPNYSREWEFGNRDEASFWKYRHVIKQWCKANGFFIGEESCIIY